MPRAYPGLPGQILLFISLEALEGAVDEVNSVGLRWPLTCNPFQPRIPAARRGRTNCVLALCSLRLRLLIFSSCSLTILFSAFLLTWRSSSHCPLFKSRSQHPAAAARTCQGPHLIYAEQVAIQPEKGAKEMQRQFQVCLSFGAPTCRLFVFSVSEALSLFLNLKSCTLFSL